MIHYPNFNFEICKQDIHSQARIGLLTTPHGRIETPNFICCATKGSLKNVSLHNLSHSNIQSLLCNTYHLLLQPGPRIIKKHQGLHNMIGWNKPIITDSGGFQIFSFNNHNNANEIKGISQKKHKNQLFNNINEQGAIFKSYLNGKKIYLTPEISINIQKYLKSDLIVQLDECTSANKNYEYTEKSMYKSHRWGIRSLQEFKKDIRYHNNNYYSSTQAIYGIVQGGIYNNLRRISSQFIAKQDFFGQAIGGNLGNNKDEMLNILKICNQFLCINKPKHLLGIGKIEDIWNGVSYGIDTFDCVYPTRLGRHGGMLILPEHRIPKHKEYINLKNNIYKNDFREIDNKFLPNNFPKITYSYIYFLFKTNPVLGGFYLTIYNIYFMIHLMHTIRTSIHTGTFTKKKTEWIY